jgi:hypothetical protein
MLPLTFYANDAHYNMCGAEFSATPFSAAAGASFLHSIQQRRVNPLPIFSGTRMVAVIPATFAYSQSFSGKSKAILSIVGGPLKGRVITIGATKHEDDNVTRCLQILMKDHVEPYVRASMPELGALGYQRVPELRRGEEERSERASAGEVASSIHDAADFTKQTLEATQACLLQARLGAAEALHAGTRTLGRVATGASAVATLGDHAPRGISRMSFREGIEAIVDFTAQNTMSSLGELGLVALASLVLEGPAGPLLVFTLGAAGSLVGSEAYSGFMRDTVDRFGQDFSKCIVSLPEEHLQEAQRDEDLMRTFIHSLCERIQRFVQCSPLPKNHVPIEFHLTSGRDIAIQAVPNRVLPMKRGGCR